MGGPQTAPTGEGLEIDAEPAPVPLRRSEAALLVIDMQRDFLEPGGFGEALGNDVSLLASAVAPCAALLAAARAASLTVIHTREGHRPDLSDLPRGKQARCAPGMAIGDPGPMGRILIRGEPGHDIVPELAPRPGELVIDKPGKGAFYATPLADELAARAISQLLVCGVTTEVCVQSTVREATDRGYDCVVAADACGSYFPEFHRAALAMISAQGGIFGAVASSAAIAAALADGAAARAGAGPS